MKPNRRYNKNNDKVEENPYLDRPDRISNKKEGNRGQNESVDMFKIRKKKLSSHKVSASSHIKLNESFNNFE